ncbi:MAG: zinc-finger domain-containing protein [Alphaproteobacteria bacterium]|nr:zinc-finger domain-containing protein [Alphaproteobacteria bacterium]
MQKYSHKKSDAKRSGPIEVIITDTPEFNCDGATNNKSAGLGHPRVFLTVNKQGFVDCPYCGRHYQLAKGASATSAH